MEAIYISSFDCEITKSLQTQVVEVKVANRTCLAFENVYLMMAQVTHVRVLLERNHQRLELERMDDLKARRCRMIVGVKSSLKLKVGQSRR